MSHFVGLCFGDNYDDYLVRYNENLEVDSYVVYTKEEAIDEAKRDRVESYGKIMSLLADGETLPLYLQKIYDQGICLTYDEAWKECKQWGYKIDDNENLTSTYNPDSKWDWYEIGGRWSGFLVLKNGSRSSEATVDEVDWERTNIPFCFTDISGNWYEKGEMGWWCVVSNEKTEDCWKDIYKSYIKKLDKNITVTVIDFHI